MPRQTYEKKTNLNADRTSFIQLNLITQFANDQFQHYQDISQPPRDPF